MQNKQLVINSSWSTVSAIVLSLTQILRLSILTRFLDKSDFGIVAIMTIVLGLTLTFSDLGFSVAIMHKRDISREEYSSLYWTQLFFFCGIYLLVFVLAYPISLLYKTPSITSLLPIAMIDIVFQGIGKLYDTLLLKEFQLKTIAIRNIVSSVISLVAAFVLAVLGCGIYSLILSTLLQTFILNIWNFIVGQRCMPIMFYCSPKQIIPLLKIGVFQTGTQILDYIASKLDILIIGRLLGMESLGLYNLAKELVFKVITFINSIVNRVALPYFSKMQQDLSKMRSNYCKLLDVVSLLNFLLLTITCALSPYIVYYLYGENYGEVAPVMSILSIWGMLISLGNPVGLIVAALGKTNLSFRYTIVRLFISIPITYLCCHYGLLSLSWGQVLLAKACLFITWKMILKESIELRLSTFLRSFMKQGVVAICISFVFYIATSRELFEIDNRLLLLLGCSILITLLYFVMLFPKFRSYFNYFNGRG